MSTSGAISLSPQVNGTAVGSVTAQRGRQYKIPRPHRCSRHRLDFWELVGSSKRTRSRGGGIPGLVNTVLALQTDGLPFEIEMLFSGQCPLLGAFRVKGKAVMRIGRDLLWMRSSKNDLLVDGREDIDSATFRDWVKRKTQNSWAENVEYED